MATMAGDHSDAIDYDAFRVPALLLDGWVADQRGDDEAAALAYWRALELARRIGFDDHAAMALSGLGAGALARGDLGGAEELQRQSLALAEAADATWVVAHARVQLARIAAASGDPEAAERLYRDALEWSELERPHQARESLFIALAGTPADAARQGLAELPDRLVD
jgi:tetratricopeptide (TPR) repeat protein